MDHETSACEVLVISGADVRRLVSMRECIDIIEGAMRTVSRGGAQLPLRIGVTVPGGVMAVMPGLLEQPPSLGAKVIAVFPGNAQRGLSSHMGVVILFDPQLGVPLAMTDAAAITGLRTAAATAVATNALAREDADELAILGTGEQAAAHLHAIAQVRRLRSVRIWGRSNEKAQAFAARERERVGVDIVVSASVRDAVSGASIVCTTTGSKEPILAGEWIARGAHVNLVGASSAAAREADDELVKMSRFFVDFKPSALAQAGELLGAMGTHAEAHIVGEIGDVLNGSVPGRTRGYEVTVYKSLGIAAQDLAVAHTVYERARQTGCGVQATI